MEIYINLKQITMERNKLIEKRCREREETRVSRGLAM